MRRAPRLLALLVALAAPSARADTIHLANGRTIEGRIVERTPTDVHIEVAGGRFVVPATLVAHVVARATPQDELAERSRRTDMGDPDAVARLAEWAASRGLGSEAQQLEAHAQGVRLDRLVAAARAQGRAGAWLDVYVWARDVGLSAEVRIWLAEQALRADPADREAERALTTERRVNAVVEGPPVEARPRPAPPPPPPPPPQGPPDPRDRERIAQLEAALAAQEAEAEALRARVGRMEEQRRGVRRRRPPTNPPIQPGLFLVPAPAPPPAPPPPR